MDLLDDVTPTAEESPCLKDGQVQNLSSQPGSSARSGSQRSGDCHSVVLNPQSSSNSSSLSSSGSSSSSSSLDHAHGLRGRAAKASSRISDHQSDMSNSYHEIFDTQMPPEKAKSCLSQERSQSPPALEELQIQLPGSHTAASTTDYLTNKLVQDSLLWQKEHSTSPGAGVTSSGTATPERSPMHQSVSGVQEKNDIKSLNPTLILDIENDAHHLATSVDNLVESLSGIMHSISALTVDTMETYRDGICKTCDEVDNNIKGMYQLMAKVEELNKNMQPAYKLGEKLKDIKRHLDRYEAVVNNPK